MKTTANGVELTRAELETVIKAMYEFSMVPHHSARDRTWGDEQDNVLRALQKVQEQLNCGKAPESSSFLDDKEMKLAEKVFDGLMALTNKLVDLSGDFGKASDLEKQVAELGKQFTK